MKSKVYIFTNIDFGREKYSTVSHVYYIKKMEKYKRIYEEDNTNSKHF